MKRFVNLLCVVLLVCMLATPSMAKMTDSQRLVCHGIIHSAAGAAAGAAAGLAQIPLSDNLVLAGIIGSMTLGLAQTLDVSLVQMSAETVGLSVLSYFGGTIAIRNISQLVGGWLPLVGNSLNATTAAGLVEYIGWKMAYAFEAGNWAMFNIALEVGSTTIGTGVSTGTAAVSSSAGKSIWQTVKSWFD